MADINVLYALAAKLASKQSDGRASKVKIPICESGVSGLIQGNIKNTTSVLRMNDGPFDLLSVWNISKIQVYSQML
ncbi:MAG: hypothetical protein WC958_03815 [Dehalococcoidales bacterium]